jgi:hypothetical protein
MMPDYGPYNQYQMPELPRNAPQPRAPKYPEAPRHRQTSNWIHGILTIFTGGLWGIVWIIVAMSAGAANSADRARYQREVSRWHAYQDQLR